MRHLIIVGSCHSIFLSVGSIPYGRKLASGSILLAKKKGCLYDQRFGDKTQYTTVQHGMRCFWTAQPNPTQQNTNRTKYIKIEIVINNRHKKKKKQKEKVSEENE